MHVELTRVVSIGELIQAALIVGSLIGIYLRLADRMTRIESKIEIMWRAYSERHGRR